MNRNVKLQLLLFSVPLIWGLAFPAQGVCAKYMDAFSFNALRFAMGAIVVIIAAIAFERKSSDKAALRRTFVVGAIIGVLLYAASACQQYGIQISNNVGKASFITALYMIMVPIMRFIGGKKPPFLVWIGAVVAVIGTYFLCTNAVSSFAVEDAFFFAGAVLWAVQIIIIDKFAKNVYVLLFAFSEFATCAILSTITALATNGTGIYMPTAEAVIGAVFCGVFSAGIAYTLQIVSQKYHDPVYASIVFSTESIFGAVSGVIILHEKISFLGAIGCALIFAGIVLAQLKIKEVKKVTEK